MKKFMKRNIVSLLLALGMLCGLMTVTAFASNYPDSVETLYNSAGNPDSGTYVIYDQDDMDAFVSYVNDGRNTQGVTFAINGTGNTYTVTSIIAPATIATNGTTNSPYVSAGTGFRGTFDGNDNTIKVTLSTSAKGTALFGYLAKAGIVKDLTVYGTVSSSASDAIGGVVGYNCGIIDGVSASVTVTANSSYNVGGIAGFNDGYYMEGARGTVRNSVNCYKTVTEGGNPVTYGGVSGSSKVGGIAGENAGLITSCYNTADITSPSSGKNGVGGIAGRNGNNNTAVETGVIQDCYNTANISDVNGKWVGGITGFLNSLSSCVNCYNTGNMSAISYKDPISGNTEGTNTNCYYLSGISGVEGYDGSTALSADELNGNTTVDATGKYIVEILNGTKAFWGQTTGSPPYLTGTDTRTCASATGVSYTPPSQETDGIVLGGSSSPDYTDLGDAIDDAVVSGKTIYVAGEIDLPSDTYDGAYGAGSKVLIKRSVTFNGILFTVNSGATVTLSNLTIDGNSVTGTNLIRTYGGSLALDSTVTLRNAVSNANGGAIHVQGGTVTSAATIDNCSARNGGGVYISGGSFELTGGEISNCFTQLLGAGVYVSTDTTFALNADDLTIDEDSVVYLEDDAYITIKDTPPSIITIECANPESDVKVAQGGGSHTLVYPDDLDMIAYTGDAYDFYLDSNAIYIN